MKEENKDYKVLYENLLPKYKNLVEFYDNQTGTPCEEIRHSEELSLLTEKYAKLHEAFEQILQSTADRRFHPDYEINEKLTFKDNWRVKAGLKEQ